MSKAISNDHGIYIFTDTKIFTKNLYLIMYGMLPVL